MADKYKQPALCNHYCANQCPIGAQYVPEVKVKDLSQIVLETLASLNSMSRRKDRLSGLVPDKREEPFWGEAKAGATNCVPKPPIGRADRHDRRRIKTFTALLDWGILRAAPCAGRRYYDAFAAGVAG